MDASIFWNIIGQYNEQTLSIQIGLLILLIISLIYGIKKGQIWILQIILGLINLFISIGFFFCYGTEIIQKFFAFPLFLGVGILLIYDAIHYRERSFSRPGLFPSLLLILYILYPVVSIALGSSFPKMVTHIMPCPVATLTIALYSCFKRKNVWLIVLLTLWGLTGVKAIPFHAYEDIILLLAGIYETIQLATLIRTGKKKGIE